MKNFKYIPRQKLLRRLAGFTLIELLVVVAIIGTIMGLALPAIAGALTSANITKTMSNYRQLCILTQNAALDSQTAGGPGAFPGDLSTGSPSITSWSNALVSNYCSAQTFQNLLAVNGQAANTTVYGVGSSNDPSTVFLATVNLSSNAVNTGGPFGTKGGAFVTMSCQAVKVTGTNTLPLTNGIIWITTTATK